MRVLHAQPRSRVSRSKDVSRERPSARTQLTDAGDESGRNDSPSPELSWYRKEKAAPINLSVREKLAPSAAGPFLCSGQAWNFCLVQREGRRYRLMQREGKPSPAYPNAGPALLLAGLFLWSLLDDSCAWAWRTSPGPACRQEQGRARLCTASVARRHAEYFRDLFERAETEWETRPATEWLTAYGRQIDNVRTALDWASSPGGDTELGVALTIAAVPLWRLLSLMEECRSEAVYGRCDNRRDDLADFCGPRAHLVLRV